jgi:acyl-CoA synthetase (AMP-forming)/AMP-acid ligase II
VSTIPTRLLELAEANPQREALRILTPDERDTTLSRADLLNAAQAAAAQLPASEGELVIMVQRDLLTLVSTFFGAMLKGAIPSILPFATEKLHPDRYAASMAALLSIAQPAALAVEGAVRADVEGLLPAEGPLPELLTVARPTPTPSFDASTITRPQAGATALLQHSSGTTGLQKGVMLSHATIFAQLEAYGSVLGFTEEDVVCSWLPLYHDMGLIAGFLMPLLSGARLVLMSPFDWVRSPAMLLHAITAHGGTFTWLPNFAYNFLAGKVRDRDLEGVDLSSMRAFVNCSEPVYAASHRMFAERFTPYGLQPTMLSVSYAMAEAVFGVTQTPVGEMARVDVVEREALQSGQATPTDPGPHAEEMVSSGFPLPGMEVAIVDENHAPLPERAVGDIALRGDFMFEGYYRRPEATAEAFHGGWYLTGDRGYMAEGQVYVQGRKKDLIIVGGKNVYPTDLERLANTVEGVYPGRAAAFGVPNLRSGTEDVVIVAETEADDPADRKKLAAAIRRAVAAGSDVAVRDVRLVGRGWLVKTSSGKISRSAVREKYLGEPT